MNAKTRFVAIPLDETFWAVEDTETGLIRRTGPGQRNAELTAHQLAAGTTLHGRDYDKMKWEAKPVAEEPAANPAANEPALYETGWEHVDGDEWHATGASGRIYRLNQIEGAIAPWVLHCDGQRVGAAHTAAELVQTTEALERQEAELRAAAEPVTYTVEETQGVNLLTDYRFSDGQHWRIVRRRDGQLVAVWKRPNEDVKATRSTLGSLDAALAAATRVDAPEEPAEELVTLELTAEEAEHVRTALRALRSNVEQRAEKARNRGTLLREGPSARRSIETADLLDRRATKLAGLLARLGA